MDESTPLLQTYAPTRVKPNMVEQGAVMQTQWALYYSNDTGIIDYWNLTACCRKRFEAEFKSGA